MMQNPSRTGGRTLSSALARTTLLGLALAVGAPSVLAAPGGRPKSGAPEERVSLNFVNADVEAVIRAMGQFLKRDFVIDPRVKGQVTLTNEQPVTRAEAYNLLLTALRFQGFTIVESNGVYKVLPEADAKFAGGPTQIGRGGPRTDGIRGDQIVTQIFRLNYESASNMVNMLRPLVTANNPITVNPGNNSIVITDYADNLQRIARIIAGVDTPPSADGDVVPLQYALAVDIAPLVQRVLDPQQGGQSDPGQRVTVLADARTNTIVLRASSAARIAAAKGLVAKLDVPTASAGNIHIVYLKNAEATRLAQTLRSIASGDTSTPTAPTGSSASTFAASAQGAIGGSQQSGGATTPGTSSPVASPATFGLGSGTAGTAGSTASTLANPFGSNTSPNQSGGSGSGFIQADVGTNALIITAPEPVYRNLRSIIESLDVRRPQIFIEALIVEVTANKAAEFGVQWQDYNGLGKSGSNVVGGTNFGGAGVNILQNAISPLSIGQGLNVGLARGSVTVGGVQIVNLGILARALETDDNANVLSTPNLMTLDNEEAQIIVAQNIPVPNGQLANTVGSSSLVTTYDRRDVGITLKIKPTISDNGTVKLLIYQEVSNVIQSTLTLSTGPSFTKRSVSTVVQPDEDELVVLGGLIQDQVENITNQVPVLGNIPYLGALFRYQTRTRTRTNLMVFLRPHVIRDEASKAVFAEKYDMMRKVQIDAQAPHTPPLPDMPSTILPQRQERPAPGAPAPYESPVPPSSPSLPDLKHPLQ